MTNETITVAEIFASIKAAMVDLRAHPGPHRPFGPMEIRASALMTTSYEDWSQVRSPGRARRRRRLGFRQNIVVRQRPMPDVYEIDGAFYAHPETIRRLMLRVDARHNAIFRDVFLGGLF